MERVKNVEDYAEKYTEEHASSPEDYVTARGEPPHDLSLTEVAAQALRTGLYPTRKMEEVPGEDDLLRVGDPDVDPLDNLYSGESQPSGSAPTPDQNNVDDIGRAAGLLEEDTGALRTADELLTRRDRRRQTLDPAPAKL